MRTGDPFTQINFRQVTQLSNGQVGILAQAVWLQSALLNLWYTISGVQLADEDLKRFFKLSTFKLYSSPLLLTTYFYILTTKFTNAKNLEVIPPLPSVLCPPSSRPGKLSILF